MNCQSNQRRKGYYRDRAIIEAVESRISLDTKQVRALLFPFAYGRRKAQERLLKLYQGGKLLRHKLKDGPYCYYRGDRPKMLAHLLGLNWVRIWLEKSCRSWERVHSFTYEQDNGILRADGFISVKNTVTGKYKFMFVEMDMATNPFDKVERYCRFYEKGSYAGSWWVDLTDRFPAVLIATVAPARMEHIRRLIKERNKAGLDFRVLLLDQIKKEVMDKCSG